MKVTSNGILFDYDDVIRKDQKKTESGIHIPESVKSMESFAIAPQHKVLEVGPLTKEVKKGDKIILHPNASGLSIVLSSTEKYVLFKEHDIVAIV